MKILFLTHYFPPEVNAPATRTYEHAKEWVRQGHEVTVITCFPNHPRGKVYDGYRSRLYDTEEINGIRVIRLWTYITANEGFIKRTMGYVSYMVSVILSIPFLGKHDVVASTSPQFFCGLAGYFVSRLKRIPWILEIRDLWPESIIAVGAIKSQKIIRLLEYLELKAYQKAQHIVVVTDSFKEFIKDKGIESEKISVIKNGVDLEFYRPDDIEAGEIPGLDLEGRFVASYFGTHGMAHHLETILEAADSLLERHDIVFLLIGDGAEKQRLLQLKEKRSLTNVIMLDQQSKDDMPGLWAISDVSLVHLRKSDLFKTVIPSKIFESMAMRKPIILGVEGEVKKLIDQSGSGIPIEPENSSQLARAVLRLADDKNLQHDMGRKGRVYVEKYFDRKKLADRYLAIMEKLRNDA